MPFVICYGIDDTFAFSEISDGTKIGTGQPHSELFLTKAAALQRLVDLGYDPIEPTISGESAMPLAIDLTALKAGVAASAVLQGATIASLTTVPLIAINLVSSLATAERTGVFTEFLWTLDNWFKSMADYTAVKAEVLAVATAAGVPEAVIEAVEALPNDTP